jgi:hypothetical protein
MLAALGREFKWSRAELENLTVKDLYFWLGGVEKLSALVAEEIENVRR